MTEVKTVTYPEKPIKEIMSKLASSFDGYAKRRKHRWTFEYNPRGYIDIKIYLKDRFKVNAGYIKAIEKAYGCSFMSVTIERIDYFERQYDGEVHSKLDH